MFQLKCFPIEKLIEVWNIAYPSFFIDELDKSNWRHCQTSSRQNQHQLLILLTDSSDMVCCWCEENPKDLIAYILWLLTENMSIEDLANGSTDVIELVAEA